MPRSFNPVNFDINRTLASNVARDVEALDKGLGEVGRKTAVQTILDNFNEREKRQLDLGLKESQIANNQSQISARDAKAAREAELAEMEKQKRVLQEEIASGTRFTNLSGELQEFQEEADRRNSFNTRSKKFAELVRNGQHELAKQELDEMVLDGLPTQDSATVNARFKRMVNQLQPHVDVSSLRHQNQLKEKKDPTLRDALGLKRSAEDSDAALGRAISEGRPLSLEVTTEKYDPNIIEALSKAEKQAQGQITGVTVQAGKKGDSLVVTTADSDESIVIPLSETFTKGFDRAKAVNQTENLNSQLQRLTGTEPESVDGTTAEKSTSAKTSDTPTVDPAIIQQKLPLPVDPETNQPSLAQAKSDIVTSAISKVAPDFDTSGKIINKEQFKNAVEAEMITRMRAENPNVNLTNEEKASFKQLATEIVDEAERQAIGQINDSASNTQLSESAVDEKKKPEIEPVASRVPQAPETNEFVRNALFEQTDIPSLTKVQFEGTNRPVLNNKLANAILDKKVPEVAANAVLDLSNTSKEEPISLKPVSSDTKEVTKDLIHRVIHAESRGRSKAVSSAAAKGLMQITKSPIADFKKRPKKFGFESAKEFESIFGSNPDLNDPATNVAIGTIYLQGMMEEFKDYPLEVALMAYNGGPGHVQQAINWLERNNKPIKLENFAEAFRKGTRKSAANIKENTEYPIKVLKEGEKLTLKEVDNINEQLLAQGDRSSTEA